MTLTLEKKNIFLQSDDEVMLIFGKEKDKISVKIFCLKKKSKEKCLMCCDERDSESGNRVINKPQVNLKIKKDYKCPVASVEGLYIKNCETQCNFYYFYYFCYLILKMVNAIIVEQGMAADCAAAALFKALFEDGVVIFGTRNKKVSICILRHYDNIVLIGTYWNNQIDYFKDFADKIVLFGFGKVDVAENVTVYNGEKMKLMDFIVDFFNSEHIGTNKLLIQSFLNANKQVIDAVNDKASLRNNLESTQLFFTGIYNYFEENDFVKNFTQLFTKEVLYEDVLLCGTNVFQSQIKLVFERIRRNSKTVTLKSGKTAELHENTELIDLAHKLMREKKECDISISVCLDLPSNRMKYSIRTFDDSTDASELIKALNQLPGGGGGGNSTGAGGSFDFTLNVPF